VPRSKNVKYAFMAWCLVKHRDNFNFYLYLMLVTPKLRP